MSAVLTFDKKHFNSSGLIPLKRGDDWSLDAKVISKKGNYSEDFDLTNYAASAYFPGVVSTVIVPCTITNAKCGEMNIALSATGSQLVSLAPNGVSSYIIVKNINDNTAQTIETDSEPLGIDDHGFRTF